VSSQTCRDVIGIIGRYVHPLKAQYFFEKYCEDRELSINDFCVIDVPKFILYIAEQRDNLNSVRDNQFYEMLRDLVLLSNVDNKDNNSMAGENS
jgi:hypothetical protein